jgi:ATP-dependent Clp protease ATP-binding subunit ClpA
MTDRTRPDRAIDALDEACAHTHAVAQYTERAETLIARRRRLVRERAGAATANGTRPEERRGDPEPALDTDIDDPDAVDPLDRMAKNGMAALERFGAELEAMLNGTNAGRAEPTDAPRATAEREPAPAREARTNGKRESLATLDAEIAALLLDEGIVVRGGDVARVVGLSTGQLVPWIA